MTRPGYHSEQNKKKCYLKYISHTEEIRALHKKICEALEKKPMANFELAVLCEVEVTTICGRIGDLKDTGFVEAHPKLKKKNPKTNYDCVCWILTPKYHRMSGDQTAMNFN